MSEDVNEPEKTRPEYDPPSPVSPANMPRINSERHDYRRAQNKYSKEARKIWEKGVEHNQITGELLTKHVFKPMMVIAALVIIGFVSFLLPKSSIQGAPDFSLVTNLVSGTPLAENIDLERDWKIDEVKETKYDVPYGSEAHSNGEQPYKVVMTAKGDGNPLKVDLASLPNYESHTLSDGGTKHTFFTHPEHHASLSEECDESHVFQGSVIQSVDSKEWKLDLLVSQDSSLVG